MSGGSLVLRAEGLTKRFGRKVANDRIDLEVGQGRIFGFLGKNGAGKSTFVKMMVGLTEPTAGRAELLGRPLDDFRTRGRIGFLPENFRYQEWLSPLELLAFHGRLKGMPAADIHAASERVLADVGLAAESRNKIRSFSKGMQQRLGLACAMLGEPELLFLDEPTSALDPIGRHDVRELLVRERARGATVFLNSHLLSEIELVCDEVAFLDSGRIVEAGLLSQLLGGRCEVDVELAAPFIPTLPEDGPRLLSAEARRLLVEVTGESEIPALVGLLVEQGARIVAVGRRQRSLESLFLETVGDTAHEQPTPAEESRGVAHG